MPSNATALDDLCSPPLTCFDCGHEYWFMGTDPHHPAACASCGSRAVSFAGSVRVTDTQVDDRFADESAGIETVQVVAEDASTRPIVFTLQADADSRTAVVRAVRLGTARVAPDHEHWSEGLLPDAVVSAVEEAGYHFVPPAPNENPGRGGP